MRYTYPAVFIKENNCYSVIFPGFLGGTQGSSLDEARVERYTKNGVSFNQKQYGDQ